MGKGDPAMSTVSKYDEIFMDIFQVDRDQLNEGFAFAAIESWDSLAHITLITRLESEFDVFFETEDILTFGSYENGKKILQKYGVELSPAK